MSIHKKFARLSTLLVGFSCLPAMATVETTHLFNSASDNSATTYLDFQASSAVPGHESWALWESWEGGAGAGTKYYNMTLSGASAGKCYLVTFAPVSGTAANTDIRFWTPYNVSLDDDGPSTSLPKAQIWSTGPMSFRVSAYSTSYNSVDFRATTKVLNITSAASCRSNADVNNDTPFYNYDTNFLEHADNSSN